MSYRRIARAALPVLLGALLAAGVRPARADDPPDAEKVAAARAHLEEALRMGDEDALVDAVEGAFGIPDPELIDLVDRAMWTRMRGVVRVSLESLGHTPHADALKKLHAAYRKVHTQQLDGYEDLFALLLKEIGRHGDPSSIEILTDSPFRYPTYDVGMARIMGLGRIRVPEAVEALVDLSRKAGGRGAMGAVSPMRERFRPAFRTAMVTLTGVDRGDIPADWDTWWRDHRRGLKIEKDHPQVPEDVQALWESYWGEAWYPTGGEPPPPRMGSPLDVVLEPTPAQVQEAVEGLKEAFRSRDDQVIVAALERYGGTIDRKVIHEIAGGLRSRSKAVRLATLEVLGWIPDDAALKQLHREFRRTKQHWGDDEDVFAELLQAIGRHGDPSSVEVLAESPFKGLTILTGRARILGLANIRTNDAVEELIKGTQLAGDSRPRSWRPAADKRFVREFELALTVLTGQQFGRDLEGWRQWWRDVRRTFKVSPERPPVPDWMWRTWEDYWREPYIDR